MDEVALNGLGPNAQQARVRKRMRKGTHSCNECRRRKIRCLFPPNSSVCSPCSSRGSRCVDQLQQPFPSPASSGHTTLSSATRVEPTPGSIPPIEPTQSSIALVAPIQDLTFSDIADSDADVLSNEESNQVPLVSFIADSELWSTGSATDETSKTMSPTNREGSRFHNVSQMRQRRAKDVCTALRSALPSYDSIMATLSEHGSWWESFRFKTHLNVDEPAEGLLAFASRTYTSGNPSLLGTLVTAYARCLNRYHQLYAIVESLVISETEYVSTVEGLQCLILLAKSLTEVGHPRRSWLIWRKGMAIAQLLGLYRTNNKPVIANNIWWTIFHGDRFTSLLLGVPHGFNDSYFTSQLAHDQPAEAQLITRTVMIAGKLIERNLVSSKPSIAETLSLDEEFDTLTALLPDEWWDTADEMSRRTHNDQLRERVLLQFYFFHIRTYLHLPFMAKSVTTPTSIISKHACMEASRQMLKRFLLLHSTVDGTYLFECKTTAFLSFMAAVLLILGVHDLGHHARSSSSNDDMALLDSVRDIFRRNVKKDGSKISSQCCNALEMLMRSRGSQSQKGAPNEDPEKIFIPYFGLVLCRRKSESAGSVGTYLPQAHNQFDQGHTATSQVSGAAPPISALGIEMESQTFEYLGPFMGDPMSSHATLFGEGVGLDIPGDASWTDALMMDLDQDWTILNNFGDTY
ncbi:hypothetical protein EDB81DRAFT_807913 [Dactylonectria macrodidyma]|uniref:Zn(2)-C6 fungal-type domain-containing protein n=1 Tax=Dactylonectria macrodidyma TaxID=307937 RepID=A0A9P9E552_9HYPO|nr:hypothetical protein EDB81DRAFT_807913 [Dactylonectria macrodidyma]